MRTDEQERGAGLEADAAFDAERGLTHVDIAADAVLCRQLAQGVDQSGAGERLAVQRHGKALVPGDHYLPGIGNVGTRLQQLIRWAGPGVVGPAPAPGGAPESAIDRVVSSLGWDRKATRGEKGDRLLSPNRLIPNGSDDLEIGREDPQGDVEANLIISRAGGAVRHSPGADPAGDVDHGKSLLGALGRDTQGVDLPPEHVALNQEP